jgi:hypothetical protein
MTLDLPISENREPGVRKGRNRRREQIPLLRHHRAIMLRTIDNHEVST